MKEEGKRWEEKEAMERGQRKNTPGKYITNEQPESPVEKECVCSAPGTVKVFCASRALQGNPMAVDAMRRSERVWRRRTQESQRNHKILKCFGFS